MARRTSPSTTAWGGVDSSAFNYNVHMVGNVLTLTVAITQINWTGSSNNLWNFSDLNWSTGNQKYGDGGQAVFTDTGANTAISLTAAVNPQAGVVFNNTSGGRTYSITNSGGSIGGPGGLTLNGTGTVNLDAGNPYAGTTVINAGTLNRQK